MVDSPLVHRYRKQAVAYLESVTPAEAGSSQDLAVCQGRTQQIKSYSGCADLAHAMYEALGLQHRRLNRAPAWRSRLNVSLLAGWSGATRPARPGLPGADGGDVLIRWSPKAVADRLGKIYTWDAHIVCVMARDGEQLATAEFGQRLPLIGRQFVRPVVPAKSERPWQVWLPLPAVLEACGVR
jgi:hypothetical protein